MSNLRFRIQRGTVAAILAATATGVFGIQQARAELGHVSCHVRFDYEFEGGPGNLNTYRDAEFSFSPGASHSDEFVLNTADQISHGQGPNFPVGLRISTNYLDAPELTPGIPGSIQFALMNPNASVVLPQAQFRGHTVSVPFQQQPIGSSSTINVNWSTAVSPSICIAPDSELRGRTLRMAESVLGGMNGFLHGSTNNDPNQETIPGWLNSMTQVQNEERQASRARTHAERVRLRAVALQHRQALMEQVRADMGIPSGAFNSPAVLNYLKARKTALAQKLARVVILNNFTSRPDSAHLGPDYTVMLRDYERVLSFLGVRDRQLVGGAHGEAITRYSRRTQRDAALAAQERQLAVQEAFGPNTTHDDTNGRYSSPSAASIADGGLEPDQLLVGGNTCAIVHITVENCTAENIMPMPQPETPSVADDAGASTSSGGSDSSVDDAGAVSPAEQGSSAGEQPAAPADQGAQAEPQEPASPDPGPEAQEPGGENQ